MYKYLIALMIITLASCHLKVNMNEHVRNEVDAMLHNYYNDIAKEGLLAEFKYLDSSADFFWVPPGYAGAVSYDSVAKAIRKNAAQLASVQNSFESLRIVPLSAELASYTARIKSTSVDTAGNTYRCVLLETGVVRKANDGWKLLNGQTAVIQ